MIIEWEVEVEVEVEVENEVEVETEVEDEVETEVEVEAGAPSSSSAPQVKLEAALMNECGRLPATHLLHFGWHAGCQKLRLVWFELERRAR